MARSGRRVQQGAGAGAERGEAAQGKGMNEGDRRNRAREPDDLADLAWHLAPVTHLAGG